MKFAMALSFVVVTSGAFAQDQFKIENGELSFTAVEGALSSENVTNKGTQKVFYLRDTAKAGNGTTGLQDGVIAVQNKDKYGNTLSQFVTFAKPTDKKSFIVGGDIIKYDKDNNVEYSAKCSVIDGNGTSGRTNCRVVSQAFCNENKAQLAKVDLKKAEECSDYFSLINDLNRKALDQFEKHKKSIAQQYDIPESKGYTRNGLNDDGSGFFRETFGKGVGQIKRGGRFILSPWNKDQEKEAVDRFVDAVDVAADAFSHCQEIEKKADISPGNSTHGQVRSSNQ